MLQAGITGGIGSGKTSACMIFEALGIPVYYADAQAKQLMNTDPELKVSLQAYFGNNIYRDGILDRRRMAEIIFNQPAALEQVNAWVHPAVARNFESWCARQTSPYVLEESAIIFECNIAHRFGKLILVTAPESVRIARVCARDRVTPDAVRQRMANQWPEDRKIPLADYIIHNDDAQLLTPQVMEIHRKLIKHSEQKHGILAENDGHTKELFR